MGIITPADLTFNGKEIQSLNEAVLTDVFAKPALHQIHTVVTGVTAKMQIAFLGLLGLVGKKKAACDITANTGGIAMTEKFWQPEYITDRFEDCWETLKGTFFIWGLKNGIQKPDLTATDFANFFQERLSDAIYECWLRVAWFSDKQAADADGSPYGYFTAGIDLDFWNTIDGFWKQLFSIATTDTNRRSTIARNAQTSISAQKFTAADTTNRVVMGIFEDMKYNADFRLREKSDLMFVVTQSMFDQYSKELRSYTNVELSYERIEGGYTALSFEGIPVIAVSFFDRMISGYMNDGAGYYRPHRAVLTTKEQLQIGIEEEAALSEFDPFYDKRTKKYYVDFGFMMDAKVSQDHLVQVAF